MRTRSVALPAAFLVALAVAAPASAQLPIQVGAFGVHATEAFDGSSGVGALVSLDLPVLPVEVRATGERFFPDCEEIEDVQGDGCTFWGYSLDVNLRLPVFFVRPYLSGGVQFRFLDPGDAFEGTDETNATVGAGLDVAVGDLNVFGEARYEFTEVPEEQWIARVGIILF